MASAMVTLIVKGGLSAISDVAGLDLLPHLNEDVVDTVYVDRAPLNTTSVTVPLVDRCHRSGWLPIRVWTNSCADLASARRRRLLLSHSALDPRAYRAAHLHRGALPHRVNGRTVPAEQQASGVGSASRTQILVPHGPTLIGLSGSNSDLFGVNGAQLVALVRKAVARGPYLSGRDCGGRTR
jgi:hypothetical protein